MSWTDLPEEMQVAVIEEVRDARDLKNLCEVSRNLSRLATPVLYRSITIKALDEQFLDESIDVGSLPLHCNKPRHESLLRYTESIHLVSDFNKSADERCLHNGNEDDFDIQYPGEWDPDRRWKRVWEVLEPVFEACIDGKLLSFTWALGTCVPQQILGPKGYLPTKQNRIENLRLITDGSCEINMEGEDELCLSTFEHLRSISWTGLRSPGEIQSLAKALQLNSDHLEKLDLDSIGLNPDIRNFIFKDILDFSPSHDSPVFPVLRELSLSGIATMLEEKLASVFSKSLVSLKLRRCCAGEGFLKHLLRSNQVARLKSLEIQLKSEYNFFDDENETIASLIKNFEGLEEFFVSTIAVSSMEEAQTLDIWRSVSHHKSTLRRFVHHSRHQVLDEIPPFVEREFDHPELNLPASDIADLTDNASENLFSDLDFECLGLCWNPKTNNLPRILSPLTKKRCLKILHIRQSAVDLEHCPSWGVQRASDPTPWGRLPMTESMIGELTTALQDFAQWAFGPDGFPALQLLAFGDYSYGKRLDFTNALLCRKTAQHLVDDNKTFRRVTEAERDVMDLCDQYADFLEACPAHTLLEDDY